VILLIVYAPFLVASLLVLVSTILRYVEGQLNVEIIIVATIIALLTLVIGVFMHLKNDFVAALLLVSSLLSIGFLSFLLWGLIHPIGFLLILLGLGTSYILFQRRFATLITGIILLTVFSIGVLHLTGRLNYDSQWLPVLTIFDFIIIFFLLTLFSLIAWVNALGISWSTQKVREIQRKLKETNLGLKRSVIRKTKEIMSSKTKLTKSYKTLEDAYNLLEDSEADRFTKMNMLAHYGMMMSSVIHGMANPLMLVMSRLETVEFKHKKEVIVALSNLTKTVAAVRANVKISDKEEKVSILTCVANAVQALSWRLEKEGAKVINDFQGSDFILTRSGSKFYEVILNLLINAIEATQNSKKKRIKITYLRKNKLGTLKFENSGEKIPSLDFKRVFRMFYSTKKGGSGIGLYVSKKYARNIFNGDLKLLGSDNEKTVFEFSFKL
jgi:signal transduction histidine kinase